VTTEARHPLFSDEHEELRRSIRTFVEKELRPHAEEWEAAKDFPNWVFARMGELGLLGLHFDEADGGSGGDYLTMLVAQAGLAVPSFWAGLLLILLFSVHLGWFRSGGFEGWSLGFWAAVRSLLLPAVALGLFQAAVLIRATRSSLLEVLGEEYVRTARAKGVSERLVVLRHALRNALIPVVTVAGLQLGQLLAGSIVLESVFALPGLGRLALGAITARDLPVVQGVTLFVASCIVVINFAVDLSYAWLDPRIRYD